MTDAKPGFFATFLPTAARAFRTALPGKRALLLLAALAAPPLVTLPLMDDAAHTRGTALVALVVYLYLMLLVPLTGLIFGTAVIGDEESAGNLPFLFARPAPRSAIVLARAGTFLVVGWIALGSSLLATFLLSTGANAPDGFGGRAALAVLAAYPAYLAAFTLLSCFPRFAIVGGFFYAFGFEGAIGLIPGMIRRATLLFYSRSLLGGWEGRKISAANVFGPEGPVGTGTALAVLAGVTVVAALGAIHLVGRKEPTGRNPGRA